MALSALLERPYSGTISVGSTVRISCSRLASIHNLFYYQELMAQIRTAIEQDRFDAYAREFYEMQYGGA